MKRHFFAALVLLTASAAAQEPPPPQQPRPPQPMEQMQPITAEAAAQEAAPPAEPEPEYSGPAILSRGANASVGRVGSGLLRFRPFVAAHAMYDTGLATVSVNEQGQLVTSNGSGMDLSFGVMGSRRWRRTAVEVDYRGSLRHYSNNPYHDGMDNMLMFGVQHQLSRRVAVVFQETGARYSRSFFLPMGVMQFYDPTLASMANTDMFDTPTLALITGGRIVYQHNARLSFSAGGSELAVRRRSTSLLGLDGVLASGDMAYRLSRFQTLSVQYDFSRFTFKNEFGISYVHGAALNYSLRMGRNWELQLRAGGYRLETSRLQAVRLDPAVAEILGISEGVAIYYGVAYLPRYDAQLSRRFRHASVTLGYSRSIMPGNGVYMTSGVETGRVTYSYSGIRRVGLGASFGVDRYRSMMQPNLGVYSGYGGSGYFSYVLGRGLAFNATVGARNFSIVNSAFQRMAYRGEVGLSWSPGDYPLSLW